MENTPTDTYREDIILLLLMEEPVVIASINVIVHTWKQTQASDWIENRNEIENG